MGLKINLTFTKQKSCFVREAADYFCPLSLGVGAKGLIGKVHLKKKIFFFIVASLNKTIFMDEVKLTWTHLPKFFES